MNWKDLASFITSAFAGNGRPPLMANLYIVLRGTVSRLQLPNPGAQSPWVHVFFKEASTMEPPAASEKTAHFDDEHGVPPDVVAALPFAQMNAADGAAASPDHLPGVRKLCTASMNKPG